MQIYLFLLPVLIPFTKGAINFDHDCIFFFSSKGICLFELFYICIEDF